MPTILKIFGLRVVIYPNDHQPAHVHVHGNGCEAVFKLHCPNGPPTVRENYGFSKKELVKILRAIFDNLDKLCAAWRQIHGYH